MTDRKKRTSAALAIDSLPIHSTNILCYESTGTITTSIPLIIDTKVVYTHIYLYIHTYNMSTEANNVANAMNGSVDALENAKYIPQSILVTGGAGTLSFSPFYALRLLYGFCGCFAW